MYLIYKYIQDLALNNLKGLILHKTKPNLQAIHLQIIGITI